MAMPTTTFDPARLGPFGRSLTIEAPPDGAEAQPADALLDPDVLRRLIETHAAALGSDDLAAAGSAWAKHHGGIVIPPVIGAMTLLGHGLDVTPDNIVLHLQDGVPRQMRLVDTDRPMADATTDMTDATLAALFRDHLEPLHAHIHRASGVSRKVLWSNVGNLVAYCYDRMAEAVPDLSRVAADRARLLEAEAAAWAVGPNPLRDPVRYETLDTPGLPEKVQVRRVCCLKLRLPGKPACYTCPTLDPDGRIALMQRLGVKG